MSTDSSSSPHAHLDQLLAQHITALIGAPQPATLAFLREHLHWVELGAGQTLMRQDEPGDAAYLLVSGRLRAYVRDDAGVERPVREMSRGEVIGEMSMYTGRPRSATVIAVRDSMLVRLDRDHFAALLATSPEISITFTSQIIRRLQTQHQRRPVAAPVTLALLPISAGVDLPGFAAKLAAQLAKFGRVRHIDAAAMDQLLGVSGAATRDAGDIDRRIALVLDDLEAKHDFVLLLADEAPSAWTRRCIRHGDELLLLADATQTPTVHAIEQRCLTAQAVPGEAAEVLVLLQPADATAPRGTLAWLARRPVTDHVHVRQSREPDMARLARLISRNAVGLVFGGGGARGFAHLGVWRALRERGIEIDCVGGTSIGAVMAAVVAADVPIDRAISVARAAFKRNPTGDFNLLPLVSLIKGRRARRAVESAVEELIGAGAGIEDLWKNYFCVASNYSQAREQRLGPRRPGARAAGKLRHSRRAATDGARRRPAVRRRHLQQLPGRSDAADARRRARDRRGPGHAQRASHRVRRGAGQLGAAARPPAPAPPAPLPAAVADVLPDEHHDPVQRLAPGRITRAGRPVLQSAPVQGRAAAVEPLRGHPATGRAARKRGARRAVERAAARLRAARLGDAASGGRGYGVTLSVTTLDASTLSMRFWSMSTTSKRQPSHSATSAVCGTRPSSSMSMPDSVL
jgi:NTE family protein